MRASLPPSVRRALERPSVRALSVLAGFALAAILLIATRPEPARTLEELPPVAVPVITLAPEQVTPVVAFTGRLQPAQQAVLRFEVAGRVQKRHVEPGQKVTKGDVLLSLDPADFRDRLRTARAELELERSRIVRDRARLKHAELRQQLQSKEVNRSRELGARDLLSDSAISLVEDRLATVEATVAELEHSVGTADLRIAQREAAADQAQRDFERTQLTAPFSGQVNSVVPEVGDRMTGNEVVVELVAVSELDFYVEVDGDAAAALTLGDTLSVHTATGPIDGTVIALQPNPDTRTFTHAVRVRIAGDGLLPGQTAHVRVALAPIDDVFAVPVSAVLAAAVGKQVYRIDGDRVSAVSVRLGPRIDQTQVVYGALEEGMQIVARGVSSLDPSRRVAPRAADSP